MIQHKRDPRFARPRLGEEDQPLEPEIVIDIGRFALGVAV
jgi:hypothetical protein